MSAVIVGSPSSGSKVLRRADFATQRNGLETLNEIYVIRTEDRASIQPSFGTLHKNYSTATNKYARMAVENFSFRQTDGDLTEINVTYIGLTSSSGLPPALVRMIPTPDAGIYGPPMIIEVEFITDKTETQFLADGCGGTSIRTGIMPPFGTAVGIPAEINGTLMPKNPREPFTQDTASSSTKYHGYLQQSLDCERRGIFLEAKIRFTEGQSGLSVIGQSKFDTGRKT
jgi:hypothetical protein